MTPAARVQAAIELLDLIIDGAISGGAPADRIITDYLRQRRYAGSKDRRAIREMAYRAIRICAEIPDNGRAAILALAADDPSLLPFFDGSVHGPQPVTERDSPAKAGIVPNWLKARFNASGIGSDELDALVQRAPLDLRVNHLKCDRGTLQLPISATPLDHDQALRLPPDTRVDQWQAYRDGLIEIQDLGSQLCCAAVHAKPGELLVDLCAGAGGKSLALAAQMHNQGRVLACDIDRRRLSRLAPRAERAGATIIETRLLNPDQELENLAEYLGKCDRVVIDAPCSGSGTLRRKPEVKWRITPKRISQYAATQDRLLDIAAQLLRPGGELAFITCSLLDEEGADRIAAFLGRNAQFSAVECDMKLGRRHGAGWRLTPSRDGTDGFFLAKLVSAC